MGLVLIIFQSLIFIINIQEKMLNIENGLKWTSEEQKMLKQLRDYQIQRNIVNWQIIANQLNFAFPKFAKTPKQCREKYINHARLQIPATTTEWTNEQIETLCQIYTRHGPRWSYFSSILIRRSQNNIKNKFNNGLRRVSKILFNKEGEIYKHTKRNISFQMLISMVEFVNEIEKLIHELNLTINYQSKFFQFRSHVLKLSLKNQKLVQQQIVNLIKSIKSLNCKIRCFGIFKIKSRKTWKLTRKGLINILEFDKVIKQDIQQVQELQHKSQQSNQKKTMAKQPSIESISYQSSGVSLRGMLLQEHSSDFIQIKQTTDWHEQNITLQKQYLQILGQTYEQLHPLTSLMI